MALTFLLIMFTYANDYITDNYRKAAVYTSRELWKNSDIGRTTSRRLKIFYKENVDKEHRMIIGNFVFPLSQILINKEIRYEWEF